MAEEAGAKDGMIGQIWLSLGQSFAEHPMKTWLLSIVLLAGLSFGMLWLARLTYLNKKAEVATPAVVPAIPVEQKPVAQKPEEHKPLEQKSVKHKSGSATPPIQIESSGDHNLITGVNNGTIQQNEAKPAKH